MILSDLVSDDPRGYIDLDRNLARHIGKENVEAFHEEAGNLVIDAMTDDPKLFEILMGDKAVVAELSAALGAVETRAFGRTAGAASSRESLASTGQQIRSSIAQAGVARSMVHAEILTNGVINDRTMRNPKVMEILSKRVGELYAKRKR